MRNVLISLLAVFAAPLLAQGPPTISSSSLEKMLAEVSADQKIRSFVYIEDFEVRHEILFPFALIDQIADIPQTSPDLITRIERRDSARKIVPAVLRKNPVKIDQIPVKPSDFKLVYFDVNNLTGEGPEVMPAANTVVGTILYFDTKGVPSEVSMEWTMFDEGSSEVAASLLAFDGTPETMTLTPDNHRVSWTNPGREPLPPLTALEAGEQDSGWFSDFDIQEEDATAILETLLKNVYRAFDYRDEEDIYDALALSIGGDLLNDVYLQIREGLVYAAEGGSVSRVRGVEFLESKLQSVADEEGPQFQVAANWLVTGTVEHWGHRHTRVNRYGADFTVHAVEGDWKITEFQVTGQERVSEDYGQRE